MIKIYWPVMFAGSGYQKVWLRSVIRMQKEVPGCGKKIHDVERGTVGGVWQEDAMVLQWYRGAARMPWRIKITPKRLGEVMPSTEHLGLMDVLNLPESLEVKRVTLYYRAYRQYRFA